MKLGRASAWFLTLFGVWSMIIWPTFLKNIWKDPRSWSDGPTAFFLVHLALTAVSLTAGLIVGAIGWRSVRALKRMSE